MTKQESYKDSGGLMVELLLFNKEDLKKKKKVRIKAGTKIECGA